MKCCDIPETYTHGSLGQEHAVREAQSKEISDMCFRIATRAEG
jgi:hypothetical protein